MKKLIFVFVLISMFITVSAQNANQKCYMCHAQPTLSIKNNAFGIITSFYVDSVAYNKSYHAHLNCTDCHSKNFQKIPHLKKTLSKHLKCLDCHGKNLVVKGEKFSEINAELKKSVHYQKFDNKLACSFCHDPHTMALKKSSFWKIRDNFPIEDQMCVECHDTEYKWFKGSAQRVNLKAIHRTVKKWREKKCVDCHTNDKYKHDIIFLSGVNTLPKK